MIDADNAVRRHAVLDIGDLHQRNFAALLLRGIDIKVLNVGEPGALVACRRATTGMFLSPSCRAVTTLPLMALVAELATSILVMPARLARSGSILQRHLEAFLVPLIAHAASFHGGAHYVLHLIGDLRISATFSALRVELTSAWLTMRISTG